MRTTLARQSPLLAKLVYFFRHKPLENLVA